MISQAWNQTLDRIASRSSSPILMPLALAALAKLADEGKIRGGRVSFQEFEKAFADVTTARKIGNSRDAWRPYFHLAGGAQLWTLWKGDSPANFHETTRKKPSSAAGLRAHVDHARLQEDLARDLQRADVRTAIRQRIEALFAAPSA